MTTRTGNYALKLPLSIKAAAEQLAKQEGVSLNQFILAAVAKEVGAAEARRTDIAAFDRLLTRDGGQPPCAGDELPDGWTEEDTRRLLEAPGPLRLREK